MSDVTGSVLVLGATGNVGRHVVGELVASGTHVRAHTRDAARAAEIIPGVELVEEPLVPDAAEEPDAAVGEDGPTGIHRERLLPTRCGGSDHPAPPHRGEWFP